MCVAWRLSSKYKSLSPIRPHYETALEEPCFGLLAQGVDAGLPVTGSAPPHFSEPLGPGPPSGRVVIGDGHVHVAGLPLSMGVRTLGRYGWVPYRESAMSDGMKTK